MGGASGGPGKGCCCDCCEGIGGREEVETACWGDIGRTSGGAFVSKAIMFPILGTEAPSPCVTPTALNPEREAWARGAEACLAGPDFETEFVALITPDKGFPVIVEGVAAEARLAEKEESPGERKKRRGGEKGEGGLRRAVKLSCGNESLAWFIYTNHAQEVRGAHQSRYC